MSLKLTGGAQIGWVSATWPFAQLVASPERLSVGGRLLGSYDFSPNEVAALEPRGWVSRGVRIVHTNPTYPEKIIFFSFRSPERLIQKIEGLGFLPTASIAQVPHRNGIPYRWSFVIALVVMWNALLLIDMYVIGKGQQPPGGLAVLAVGLLFATSVALDRSPWFQSLALKPGRSVSEVRSMVRLVQLVAGLMLIFFGFDHASG